MYTKPTEPRSIGGVLDDGLKLWRGSLAMAWPLAFLAQLVVAIPVAVLGYKLKGLVSPVTGAPTGPMSAASTQAMLELFKSPATWLTYLVILVLSALFYTALVLRISAVADGAVSSVGAALSSALRVLPRLLLQFLLFFVVFIVAAVAAAFAVAVLTAVGGRAAFVVYIVLFVAAIFVFGRVFFASIVLILDDAGPAESVAISWRLTKGYWWRCAGILLVLFIIGLVFSLVVGFISAALGGSLGPTNSLATGVSQLISLLVNTVLGSLYPAVLIAILYDLKLRKQGGDLLGRVDALARQ